MTWLLIAFLASLFLGGATVLDNYFINRLFRRPTTLIFYSSLFNLLFLPLVFFIERPSFPPLHLLPFFLVIGLTEVCYLYPYYRALQSSDTSVVNSLFALGRIFTPLLAFLFVGEKLSLQQYAGFLVIVVGGALLSSERRGVGFKFNSAFWYMLLASFIVSLEGVAYKYLFEAGVNWSTGLAGGSVAAFSLSLLLMAFARTRADIGKRIGSFQRAIPVFALEEFLTFAGLAASTYAVSLASVSLVTSIHSFSSFFVLLYAVILRKMFPAVFREQVDMATIVKKSLLFAFMFVGIALITA